MVFVVLMLLWLFLGCYTGWPAGGNPPIGPLLGTTLLPWLCVAILGYIVLTGQASMIVRGP